ncbi:MAG: hypothetical protein FWE14_04380 [Lachnospiraceae bacterium]|nr:hypothetical protein [Lachnospiraceae bacterium]
MKMRKTVLAYLLTIALIALMLPIAPLKAFANEKNHITSEEISSMILALYDKHGIEGEIISYNESVQYTRDEVELELVILESNLIHQKNNSTSLLMIDTHSDPRMRVMEMTTNIKVGRTVTNVTGAADLEISCTVKTNLGSVSIMSITNISSRQLGGTVNFISWTQNSGTWSSTDGNKTATVTVRGTLRTEATILGQKVGTTSDHTINVGIRAT